MNKTKFMLVPVIAGLMVSCAQDSLSGDVYSRDEARTAQYVRTGSITQVRYVKIEGGSQTGAIIGALAGGMLGSQAGQGKTANTIGGIAGAGVGSVVGSNVEQSISSRQGIEITVRLDNGENVLVVQEENPRRPSGFEVGQRVRVIQSGSTMRVAY